MQSNGALCEMICRGLMLELERAGHIVLPPVRWKNPNPLARRRKPDPPQIDTTPLRANLSAIRPLEFRLVRRTAEEPLFNGLLEHYHFLGHTQPVGEHLSISCMETDAWWRLWPGLQRRAIWGHAIVSSDGRRKLAAAIFVSLPTTHVS